MESVQGGRLVITGVQETYVKDYVMIDYIMVSDSEVSEGMKGVLWGVVDEKSK